MKANENSLKVFLMTNQIINQELKELESTLKIDLGIVDKDQDLEQYFEYFEYDVRYEAKQMSKYYEIFYSLERTIRQIIIDGMFDAHGEGWWNGTTINQSTFQEVAKKMKTERDLGITIRSTREIDYTTFGELGQIIIQNWSVFASTFTTPNAVQRVMGNLNTLRGPIAHCTLLSEDEVLRLKISVKDLFRIIA